MLNQMLNRLAGSKYTFLLLATLSAIVYLGANLAISPRTQVGMLDADEQEYYNLAGNLLHGQYQFNPRRTVGHVFLLAIVRLITFDNFLATQWVITLLFSLSAPLMYLLVRRMTRHNGLAITVGLLTIFWGPFLYYGRTLYSETIALPMFIGFLLLLPRGSVVAAPPKRPHQLALVAGMWLGLCMLVRPMYLLFAPLAIILLFIEQYDWKQALRWAIALVLGCSLVILPWSVYMTVNAGVPILISANGGETISGGLNPVLVKQGYQTYTAPDGRQSWVGPGKWLIINDNGYLSPAELQLPYAQQDRLLRERTIAWASTHPMQALYLETAKLLYLWGFYPFLNGPKQTLAGNLPTVVAVLLSLLAIVRCRHQWRQLARFWMLPVFVSLVAMVSWGSWRFRQPGDLGILLLSGVCLWSLWVKPDRLLPSAPLPSPHLRSQHLS